MLNQKHFFWAFFDYTYWTSESVLAGILFKKPEKDRKIIGPIPSHYQKLHLLLVYHQQKY
ncbi:hypothetical protein BpHYR1_013352 [Brachionus plicatilis]|uniref:Uncharacterized protein n=1 Tax=Brachionus plicatilis TaxID=10195 RepID=A0A3M7Q978_BRAPC|nr:hypothetical protein BpHYR1_013352 [Brachionus plicatilis]